MKMEVSGSGDIVFKEVFNPITLESAKGEMITICMRDSGFEFMYQGKKFSAKHGIVTEFKLSDRGNVLVDQEAHSEDRESPGPYNMWPEYYGLRVSMNDRFESVHVWTEELAHKNAGRWEPQPIKE